MSDKNFYPHSAVTQPEVSQALSAMLLDIVAGRVIPKTRLQNAMDASDAVNRRVQTIVNLGKLMVEMDKRGMDFASNIRKVREFTEETGESLHALAEQAMPASAEKD